MSSENTLRVGINATWLAPGGGLTGLLGYLDGWNANGASLSCFVFSTRQDVDSAIRSRFPDVSTAYVPVRSGRVSRLFAESVLLPRWLRGKDVQVAMTTNFLIHGCGVPQLVHHRNAKHFEIPRVASRFGRGEVREAIRDARARHALRYSSVNVFVSDYLRRLAEATVPRSERKNFVVHNGLSDPVPDSAPQGPGRGEAGRLFTVTSTAAHKDNETLIRLLGRLVELAPDVPWSLTVAGGGDWSAVERHASELGVRGRLRFIGFADRAELQSEFRRAACAVFTSRLESFGNGPLEAMANGCAVVASRAAAMPEIIADAGLLVEPGDAEAFALAVLRVERDNALREDLQDRGTKRAMGFRWRRSSELMERLLRKAAAR